MSFQTPITISEAIRNIEQNRYLLPSIQREFEWKHEKIEWLFDSIMRNYPISSFLFWRVEVVLRPKQVKGFVLLKKRWKVERTFGWWNWLRPLSKDYEVLPETSETFANKTQSLALNLCCIHFIRQENSL